MTDLTPTIPLDEGPPPYTLPVSLRQALAERRPVSIDLDGLGEIVAGTMSEARRANQIALHRAYITTALAHDPCYCPVWEGGRISWPRQDMLDSNQWYADLLEQPELLSKVLGRLSEQDRAYVYRSAASYRHIAEHPDEELDDTVAGRDS